MGYRPLFKKDTTRKVKTERSAIVKSLINSETVLALNAKAVRPAIISAEKRYGYEAKNATKKPLNLIFICTHNSRRSHMGQLWAQVAAFYYGIEHVYCYSGGTEATAFNPRSVKAQNGKVDDEYEFEEDSSKDNILNKIKNLFKTSDSGE